MRRKLAAGNWKMNGTSADLAEIQMMAEAPDQGDTEVLICPSAPLIHRAAQLNTSVKIGGQDCHDAEKGAHTGDTSVDQLADAGAEYVILGHSERRTDHGESNEQVRRKTNLAAAAGLGCIVCVGETLTEREAANTLEIIGGQLAGSIPDLMTGKNLVVAYEPVWAIGTGKIPTLDQIGDVHDFIRSRLERRFGSGVGLSVRILYGGSVKASNAAEIFNVSNVDGALVGGASLKANDFVPIIQALAKS